MPGEAAAGRRAGDARSAPGQVTGRPHAPSLLCAGSRPDGPGREAVVRESWARSQWSTRVSSPGPCKRFARLPEGHVSVLPSRQLPRAPLNVPTDPGDLVALPFLRHLMDTRPPSLRPPRVVPRGSAGAALPGPGAVHVAQPEPGLQLRADQPVALPGAAWALACHPARGPGLPGAGLPGACAHRVPTWTRREGLEGPPVCVQVTVMRRGGRRGRASRLLHWPGSGVSPSPGQHGRLGFTVFRVKSGSSQARKVPRAAPFPSS